MAYSSQQSGLLGRKIRPRYQIPQYNYGLAQIAEQRNQFAAALAQKTEQSTAQIDLGKQQLAQNQELYDLNKLYDQQKTELSQQLQTQYQNKSMAQQSQLAALTREQQERQMKTANLIGLGGLGFQGLTAAKSLGWLNSSTGVPLTGTQTAWQYGVPALAGGVAGSYVGSKKGRGSGMIAGAGVGGISGAYTGGIYGGLFGAAVGAVAGYLS